MLSIRPARIEDAKTLFNWRNDELTRAMSRNPDPVEWQNHIDWLTARLSRLEPGLFIVEQPVGTFRIDGDEISYTVAPEQRGKGIGTQMLRQARELFGQLKAEIFERNQASIKIAERAGMLVVIIERAAPSTPRTC